jgi:hypothetical protein
MVTTSQDLICSLFHDCSLKVISICTVVGENLCVPRPLEVNGKGIRGVGEVADKESHTVVYGINISQRQYFVARCLSSYVGVMSLVCIVHAFVFFLLVKLVT